MYIQLIILTLQTIFSWLIVVFLHRKKEKITLVPLYAFIAILTILTHNFSDLGFAVIVNKWFFLISSFSFFTTLMFGTLYLYLFEGPRATRSALWTIIFSSFYYITVVFLTGFETDTSKWIILNSERMVYYFWSIFAIVADIIFMAIIWELLSKLKKLKLVVRVFVITFFVFALDSLIFTFGVFGSSNIYGDVLKSDLIIRLALSVFAAPIIAFFLKAEGFTEEKRIKPKNFWEIVNFKSDLEIKISTLEEMILKEKALEKKISDAEETYKLALSGVGAGIWDWNVVNNKIIWSPKFCALLGYSENELGGDLDSFKSILHPDDLKITFDLIGQCFDSGLNFETEYRLKNKKGEYRWFLVNGITKYDNTKKPIRMVGSIIDINYKKEAELKIKEKIDELTKLNDVMVGREIKMVQLKEENLALKKSNTRS